MALGAFLEPLTVIGLLAFGTLINRDPTSGLAQKSWGRWDKARDEDVQDSEQVGNESTTDLAGLGSWSGPGSPSLLGAGRESRWRQRPLSLFGYKAVVLSPDTRVFANRLISRVLVKFPFLVEVWYWGLIYWVYQIGRAITALSLTDNTVDFARRHALQVIHLEQKLGVFIEPTVQEWFLDRPELMRWTNRIYSFIHIPGTILFLCILFLLTTTIPRRAWIQKAEGAYMYRHLTPALYEARRRTMAMCNLLAFVIFTTWPCMPPRLLSDPTYSGPDARESKSFGFVDSVHGKDGDSSVWTTNRFCNQYAAMPSLHFGYSFLIGLTMVTLPVQELGGRRWSWWKRAAVVMLGLSYPAMILAAIVATANHFVLDAVAGMGICMLAWRFNRFLLNFCPLEDWFLWALRIHKPGHDMSHGEGGDVAL